jgi:hypothetical protein
MCGSIEHSGEFNSRDRRGIVAVANGGAQRGELVERSCARSFGGLAVSTITLGSRRSKRRGVRGQAAPTRRSVVRDIRSPRTFSVPRSIGGTV